MSRRDGSFLKYYEGYDPHHQLQERDSNNPITQVWRGLNRDLSMYSKNDGIGTLPRNGAGVLMKRELLWSFFSNDTNDSINQTHMKSNRWSSTSFSSNCSSYSSYSQRQARIQALMRNEEKLQQLQGSSATSAPASTTTAPVAGDEDSDDGNSIVVDNGSLSSDASTESTPHPSNICAYKKKHQQMLRTRIEQQRRALGKETSTDDSTKEAYYRYRVRMLHRNKTLL